MILAALVLAAAPQSPAEVRGFLEELDLGEGAVIADVGAGQGYLAWLLSEAVGSEGQVWLEDVVDDHVEHWENQGRVYRNTRGVVGSTTDPMLPEGHFDLVVCRDAVHEFTRPREMLIAIRRALKPGGRFAVIDRYIGPVTERVPFPNRAETHAFLAESTLALLAKDLGLEHVGESRRRLGLHRAEYGYTHVFRRPEDLAAFRSPLDTALLAEHVELPPRATIALAKWRTSLPESWFAEPDGVRVIWDVRFDELLRPGGEPGIVCGSSAIWYSFATRCGVLDLPYFLEDEGRVLDAAVLVDTYHALFYEDLLLAQLREHLKPGAPLAILDRRGDPSWPRMHCAMKRAIDPARVVAALARQGFTAEVFERDGVFLALAKVGDAPPPATLAPIEAVWRQVFERVPRGDGSLLLMGDEPGLEGLLPELGYDDVVHSSVAKWECVRGDPIPNGPKEHDVLPFPLAPRREFEVGVAVDYDVLPDPRVLLADSRSLLLVRRPGGRADGHPSTAEDFAALPAPLEVVERVPGGKLGLPEREVWILNR